MRNPAFRGNFHERGGGSTVSGREIVSWIFPVEPLLYFFGCYTFVGVVAVSVGWIPCLSEDTFDSVMPGDVFWISEMLVSGKGRTMGV